MSVRKLKPITPGQRFRVVNGFDAITTDKPEKSLLSPIKRTGGRNSQGKMTIRQKGGGHKRRYREIDFKRNKSDVTATVTSIQYDPNRTAFIALLTYADGEKRYVIAQNGLTVGQTISVGAEAAPEIGNALPLSAIPLGTIISCIELRPGQGAVMARSAGTFAQLMPLATNYYIDCIRSRGDAASEFSASAWQQTDTIHGGGERRTAICRSRTRISASSPSLYVITKINDG